MTGSIANAKRDFWHEIFDIRGMRSMILLSHCGAWSEEAQGLAGMRHTSANGRSEPGCEV
jgi:hypothetical protein